MTFVKAEKWFKGDPGHPEAYSFLHNLWLDIIGRESDECWEDREALEAYFLILSATVVLAPWKLKSYFKSRKRTDHRRK